MRWSIFVAGLVAAVVSLSSLARADTAAPGRVVVRADRIELREPILFDTGKATIKAASQPLLDELVRALGDNAWIAALEVGVHTDERGADAYNLRISDERAAAVKAYLVAHGVADARVAAHGYGETRPLCNEHNEACWSRNRRVELVVTKSTHQ
jgi:outer membrane protein OmpA-like peptidoglycan-associated protein